MLQHTPEQEELRSFPGPLGKYVPRRSAPRRPCGGGCCARPRGGRCCRALSVCSFFRDDTHKVDVINFAQNKATKCLQNENLIDKESASLLWNFIVLLCRQNGVSFLLTSVSPPTPARGLGWDFCARLCVVASSVPVQGLAQEECLSGDLGKWNSRACGLG